MRTIFTISILGMILLNSCKLGDRTESNLSNEDIGFIKGIISLDEDENIQMFETNGGLKGFKTSGNFITNKQIATYWIDGRNDEIHSIKYKEIDSLKTVDRTRAVTYASYIEIYSSNQNNFKVYVDADSTRTWEFFNKITENWSNRQQ